MYKIYMKQKDEMWSCPFAGISDIPKFSEIPNIRKGVSEKLYNEIAQKMQDGYTQQDTTPDIYDILEHARLIRGIWLNELYRSKLLEIFSSISIDNEWGYGEDFYNKKNLFIDGLFDSLVLSSSEKSYLIRFFQGLNTAIGTCVECVSETRIYLWDNWDTYSEDKKFGACLSVFMRKYKTVSFGPFSVLSVLTHLDGRIRPETWEKQYGCPALHAGKILVYDDWKKEEISIFNHIIENIIYSLI